MGQAVVIEAELMADLRPLGRTIEAGKIGNRLAAVNPSLIDEAADLGTNIGETKANSLNHDKKPD
jgi:hypothetical protein